ncbi:hypothetical protein V8C34DRAFT_327103 [Trichoderma compactum]
MIGKPDSSLSVPSLSVPSPSEGSGLGNGFGGTGDWLDAPVTEGVRLAIFAAGNREAIHLLESIKYAHLSISNSHGHRDHEWEIGAGSTSNSSQGKKSPDILPCPPQRTPGSLQAREYIGDTHASIFLRRESGALMIKISGKQTVIYEKGNTDGTDLTLGVKGTKMRVLNKAQNCLRFGPYRFILKFAVDDQDRHDFNARLDEKLGYHYWSGTSVGVDIRTGRPVTMQRVESEGTKQKALLDWFKLVCQYEDLSQGIVGVIDAARLLYVYQTLSGLSELHRRKITHGNIRPEVLYILPDVSYIPQSNDDSQPKRAAISPLFHSLEQSRERDPNLCVAPEALENHGEFDGAKADIWALAASWLMTFQNSHNHFKRSKQPYQKVKKTLDKLGQSKSSPPPLFMNLLRQMLALEPQKRPSATEALEDIAWEPTLRQKEEIENGKKRKRVEEPQQSNRRVTFKRLSPDIDDER